LLLFSVETTWCEFWSYNKENNNASNSDEAINEEVPDGEGEEEEDHLQQESGEDSLSTGKFLSSAEVMDFVEKADAAFYRKLISFLLPDVSKKKVKVTPQIRSNFFRY